jgi:hypothetical protein
VVLLAFLLAVGSVGHGQVGEETTVWQEAGPALEIGWEVERPEFFRRVFFAEDPWGDPLIPPEDARSQRFGFYVWSGNPFWLVAEVDAAPEGRRLCVRWQSPAREEAAETCQLLPRGPARLAFAGPETSGWPEDSYAARLLLESERGYLMPIAGIAFGIGEQMPMTTPGDEEGIPTFPWPPPRPTTLTVLDRTLLPDGETTLGEIGELLTSALRRARYAEGSFYSVPGGFALATRLEQIEFDGTPKPEPGRWSAALPPRELFSLSDFVRALFTAPEGHYRVIVFVVNDRAFAASEETVTREMAQAWLAGGLNRLPASIAQASFGHGHAITALVYQFHKVGQQREPIPNPDGAAAAEQQLDRSGILAALAS